MENLNYLRKEIDNIDKELIKLFEKRMEVVLKVGEFKKTTNTPILNNSREKEVINKNILYINNKNFQKEVIEFLKNIMDISKKIQLKQKEGNSF